MYNEHLKMKFIDEYTDSVSTSKVCKTIFNALETYEDGWGADLCTRSTEELQPVVDNIVGFRTRSKWMRLIILKDYVKWCIGTDVPNACDGMLGVTSIGLDKLRRQTVANPLHLQEYLDVIFNTKESEQTTENIYRCFYWLAYGGVFEKDILSIKCSDVDLQNMIVHYKDTVIPIYREAIPTFKNCVELTQFAFKHPGYSKIIWKDRAPGDTLVRGIRSVPSLESIRVELSRRSYKKRKDKETDLKLSYYRIWISGIFYRAYEREIFGEEPNFDWVVSQQMEGKNYKLDSGRNTPDAKKRQLIRDFKEDYLRWKLAYKI